MHTHVKGVFVQEGNKTYFTFFFVFFFLRKG